MSKTFLLIITSAVGIDGKVRVPNEPVEVEPKLAKNLLHRGRARLATDKEAAAYLARQAKAPAHADPADEALAALLDASVPKVTEALAGLDEAQLARLAELEDEGKQRRGVLTAIAEARAALEADADQADGDDTADSADPADGTQTDGDAAAAAAAGE